MIKALAIDIDGTITFRDRQLDTEAVTAIRRAEEADLPVILATGNVLCFAEAASVLLGTSGPLIAEDGGVVYDNSSNQEHILGSVEEVDKGIKIIEEELSVVKHTRSSDMRRTGRTLERTFDPSDATKIFQRERLNLVAIDSGFAIHVKNPEVNKGVALQKAATLLKIKTSDIAAIGDAQNDIEMLETAGVGFALDNSHPDIKKTADHVLSQSHGAGVKTAVERIIQSKE
ncbi:hypothetical protein AKJ44_00140 [candidate division MSBL1 archaeon SCGC-AAA261F17]|uniref:Phosphoglycolate phosphatase n=2 Tax=candidate division MSBL1 TaxID=215777 RepID=A0A133UZD7_9EURY|nr:hypothetical protein AKJ42_03020 [candidate division MSBL1 archaeon SCGC-AAA261C02]KXB02527.1 hypothetical protein AKJ44_00140 [candidate division MSBL1 archaeon SCGC-AAA261F17]